MPILLSDYQVLSECKGNRHNKIYVVQHILSGTKYILKQIEVQLPDTQLREVETHLRLNSKYVIRLVDYDFDGHTLTMLIEYAKHGDMYANMDELSTLELSKLLKLYYRVLKALEYLHLQNFVHRDIKPENILLAGKLRPKLADFGTSARKNMIANTFCGTYEYMAPEVYLRCKQTDKIDVWAAGVLLYEMLHQFTPFKSDTLQSIKNKLESRALYFKPGTSTTIINFIYKALEFDSEQRPSISQLLQHKIFEQFALKESRKSTAISKRAPVCGSLPDLCMTEDEAFGSKQKKKPVQTLIFDSEYTSKNVESFVKKGNNIGGHAKNKSVRVHFNFKQLVVKQTKPKAKLNNSITECKAKILKKLKTLQDISKPEPSMHKKPSLIPMSLNDLEVALKRKFATPTAKIRIPSIDRGSESTVKASFKTIADKPNGKGIITRLYEKKFRSIVKPQISKIK